MNEPTQNKNIYVLVKLALETIESYYHRMIISSIVSVTHRF